MSDTFKYVQALPTTLAGAGATTGDTSLILTALTDPDSNVLTMTNFGSIGFGTIEPNSGTNEEQISWTGATINSNGTTTLTGVSTVLFVSPYTQTSGLSKTHAGGVIFVVSNTAGFYDKLSAKNDDETITGVWTFTDPNFPQMDNSGLGHRPTLPAQLATKDYVDFVGSTGTPDASTSVAGKVQLPTQAQVDAKTATGSTGAALVVTPATQRSTLESDYVVDTGAADAYVITPVPVISAYTIGQIFTFKSIHTNTTTSTLAVNGLATKTIKKNDGATNLAAGDIVSGQIVEVEYDGTNFQMKNPVGNAPQLLANLSTNTSLGGSDTLYPSQNATKTYVDNSINNNILKITASTDYETAARFTDISGGGTKTFGSGGVSASTTGTSGRYTGLKWILASSTSTDSLLNGSPVYQHSFGVIQIGTAGSVIMGFGYSPAAALTTAHVGFKILFTAGPTATLYATQADGTTENVSSALTTIAITDTVDVVFRINGTSSVDYYWRKNGGSYSSATNLTTNLPSTAQLSTLNWVINWVDNAATATANLINWTNQSYIR